MEAKTYTKRANARRAALAQGVPVALVEITVHKSAQEVRFGWKRLTDDSEPLGRITVAPSTHALAHPKKTPQPLVAALQREIRNGVRRPSPGGLCAQVWDWLDTHPAATVKEVKAAAPEQSWNVGNATCELYAWRRYNGHSSRNNPAT
jgi:hypothetical protein